MSVKLFKKQSNTNSRKKLLISIFTSIFIVGGVFLLNTILAQDLMEQAFSSAKSYDAIIDIWNTKDAVWNEILREWVSVWANENLGRGCFINEQFVEADQTLCDEMGWDWNIQILSTEVEAPLIVRVSKFLLRMTIVLSITMVIFNAVVYMIEVLSWKDRKTAEAKKNIARIIGWVLLALMSVWIINLIVSIPKSSLETSEEITKTNNIEYKITAKTLKTLNIKNKKINT